MNFGQVLEELKQGNKVARKGWNGKGMYVQKVELRINDIDLRFVDNECLVIKNVNNGFNTWIPSITDLFANDWEIV